MYIAPEKKGSVVMESTINDILTRRSVKKYKSTPVPQEIIDKIINAGLYAPNGMGAQAAIIVQITNKEMRNKLSKMNADIMSANTDPFYGAPAVLVVLADKSRPTADYDGSLVMANLMLAAHALGIGSCWIHRAKEEFESEEGKEILKSLGIEGEYVGIGHCILGYADGEPKPAAERKPGRVFKID